MRMLSKHKRKIAALLLVVFLGDMVSPIAALALTGGPSQPEVQAFEPAETTQMIDVGSGDFTYNIPLMDVGGYPVNISYHSGITMDQEASWVGLGWSLNPGVINRQMRCIPDDISGEDVRREYNIRTNWTAGIDLGVGVSFFELPLSIGANTGIYYNNYRGVGVKSGVSFSYSITDGQKDSKTSGLGLNLSLGLEFDSQQGIGVVPGVGLSLKSEEQKDQMSSSASVGANIGLSYNSRGGLSQLTFGLSASVNSSGDKKRKSGVNDKEEKIGATRSISATRSSSVSFVGEAVNPTINYSMQNFGFTGKLQIGGMFPLYVGEASISGDIKGSYSHQKLMERDKRLKAFGYMYMQNAASSPDVLLDFTREKDQPFRKPTPSKGDEGTPIMSIPVYQSDLFDVSGQGINGQYRSLRNDVTAVYDPQVNSWSGSGNFAIDIGIGQWATLGIDLNIGVTKSSTTQWSNENNLFHKMSFKGNDNTLFEPAPFINIGEKTIDDQAFYNEIGDGDAISIDLGGPVFARRALSSFTKYRNKLAVQSNVSFNRFKRTERSKRNQVMSYITAGQGAGVLPTTPSATIDRWIYNYPVNQYTIDVCGDPLLGRDTINRLQHSQGKPLHISELTVLNASGQRYVYGIPAYNRQQRDVVFSTDPDGSLTTGLVDYDAGVENSVDNTKGLDNFFSRETMPGYAHSYLLTEVLSPDYVDLTGNGPSTDDLGDAVRLNYSRIYGGNNLYKWRVPYNQNKANYQEGYKTDIKDDKGNYTYGEKEIWNLHSIESKTMVALFVVSDREDGLGVAGENGGKNSNAKLKKLDRIDLYSKADLIKYGSAAVPIKSVHFKYSYKLCPHVLNNTNASISGNENQGKLTLERIYFTYQKNTKGRLNPYVFHYDETNNPAYDLKKYDRWGNYKDNGLASPSVAANETEFPYTIQDKNLTDKFSSAWSLLSIDLPTGGTINVDYEADDYAYIQDKRAGQMFEIAGIGSSSSYTAGDKLYNASSPSFIDNNAHNRFVYIKSPTPVSSDQEVYNKYLQGIDFLYYRCAVKMFREDAPDKAEYVPGYCKVKNAGICPNNSNYIWIELKADPIGNDGSAEVVNPITKASWQFLRMNLPKKAYPGSQQDDPTDFMEVVKSLVAPLYDVQNIFMGFTRACMTRHWCQYIIKERSWLRLNNPTGFKYGGGCRVKSVTIADNWGDMVTGENYATYGQVYDYTTTDDGTLMSSGVASYEPLVGGDENPWRQPLIYNQKTRLAPHTSMFIELPIAETVFPSANVSYSKVTVRSYGSSLVSADKRTGYTVHRFLTAKDFPVITDYTQLRHELDNIPSLFQILSLPSIEYFTGSQGFLIELNDMHGKPLSEEVYDNSGNVVSRTTYEYVTDNPNGRRKHLKNEVTVLKPDGSIENNVSVGKSIELMNDFRQQFTESGSGGALLAIDLSGVSPPFPIPLPIVTVFPTITFDRTQFRSATTLKVVRRFGILKSTTVEQYGSKVTTSNEVYDSETGEVLLTKTVNEFDDNIYNLTYPAHLAYEGMGPAYKNIGAEFKNAQIVDGKISSLLEQYFTEGDEVIVSASNWTQSQKLWVVDPHHTNTSIASEKIFVDQSGRAYDNPGTDLVVKIIRSGRRNLSNQPIASVVSMKSPIQGDTILLPQLSNDIVNTSVTEYSDEWKINCDKIMTRECDSCSMPGCDCIYNFLSYIDQHNYWQAKPEDSVFVNMCCLDSCYYKNGSLSTDYCNGCLRHFYAVDTSNAYADVYEAVVGRCRLIIRKATDPIFWHNAERPLTSLVVMKPGDVTFSDTVCMTACNQYLETGEYPLQSVLPNKRLFTYKAKLICDPICKPVCVDLSPNQKVNPYMYGLLGNWRPKKQWVYRDMRTPLNIAAGGATDIRTQGVFADYDRFWVYNSSEAHFTKNPSFSTKYIDATTITKYNSKGAEIENRDAAGIYSSALFGYLETQAVAVAKNARYKQIAFDAFEDYVFTTDCSNPCRVDHFNFREKLDNGCLTHCGIIDSSDSHTGNYSLKVLGAGTGSVSNVRDLKEDADGVGIVFNEDSVAYLLQQEGCLPKFSPDTGRYFISAWVKESQNCTNLTYQNAKIHVSFTGSSTTFDFVPSGNIIETWQRIEGSFNVPASATQIKVDLVCLNNQDVNFDDLRIQPFNSSMKTYVYDVRTLRLMSELDENNYASFYEYDDSGGLVRVKKETEKGIMTIQENRSVLKRN